MELNGKIILVTGSSRGIGAATAKAFAQRGAKVIFHHKSEKTQKEANTIANACQSELVVHADVSDLDECRKLIDTVVKKYGRIDVLVNNAGINPPTIAGKTSPERWDQLLNTNVRSAFFLCQYALPHMPKGASIVNVSSIRAFRPRTTVSVYSLTKAALKALTESLAHDLAPDIRVNAVAPGYVETDMLRALPAETQEKFRQSSALKRFIQPNEIASAIVFLAENDAITGHTLVVDGGYLIQ